MLKCWRTGADNWWTTPVALRGKLGAVHRWRFSPGAARHTVMVRDTKPACAAIWHRRSQL